MINPRFLTLAIFIFVAAFSRLIPHPPNVTPLLAVALFGGAYFTRKFSAFIVPLAAMVVSDYFIGTHAHMGFVYLAFALVVGIGLLLRGKQRVFPLAMATLGSSVLFFVLTNFGVWAFGTMYPKTGQGLIACYIAAIPFFQNMLLGNTLYVAALFGGFRLLEKSVPFLRSPVWMTQLENRA